MDLRFQHLVRDGGLFVAWNKKKDLQTRNIPKSMDELFTSGKNKNPTNFNIYENRNKM